MPTPSHPDRSVHFSATCLIACFAPFTGTTLLAEFGVPACLIMAF
jgi:hypothetical protein